MKSIEVSARTIEEAVSDGLSKLGCSIADCKVEILQEGAKGLFGFFGSKPASVRLTLLSDDDEDGDSGLNINLHDALSRDNEEPWRPQQKPAQEPKAQKKSKPQQAQQKHQEPKQVEKKVAPEKEPEKSKMRIAANPQVVDRPKNKEVLERFKNAPLPNGNAPERTQGERTQGERNHGEKRAAQAPKQQVPRPPRAFERASRDNKEPQDEIMSGEGISRTPVPAPSNIVVHDSATLAGVAQQFLIAVTTRMGVQVQVDVHVSEDGHIFATMYGDTLGILIGRRGETLDALQYLTSLQVNKGQEEYTRVTLDTENYRAKREEALNRLASRMANRAIKTGRKVSLEPMNPYERRILHASLQNNPGVTTHSEGDEPYRHVVVVPER